MDEKTSKPIRFTYYFKYYENGVVQNYSILLEHTLNRNKLLLNILYDFTKLRVKNTGYYKVLRENLPSKYKDFDINAMMMEDKFFYI
jgi:hypothetical protein